MKPILLSTMMLVMLTACSDDNSTGTGGGNDVCDNPMEIAGLYDGDVVIDGTPRDVYIQARDYNSWVLLAWSSDLDSLAGTRNQVSVFRDLDGTYYGERVVRDTTETTTSTISGCFDGFTVSYKQTFGDSTVIDFQADVKKMKARP